MLEILLSTEPAPCWRASSGLKSVAKGMMYVRYDCSRKVSAAWAVSPASFGSARAIVLAAYGEAVGQTSRLKSTVRRVQRGRWKPPTLLFCACMSSAKWSLAAACQGDRVGARGLAAEPVTEAWKELSFQCWLNVGWSRWRSARFRGIPLVAYKRILVLGSNRLKCHSDFSKG